MKTRMRPRYYCDHCGKGSGSPSAMRRHESGCTLNPRRICRMCRLMGNPVADGRLLEGISMFLQPAIATDWPARMKALREAVCNCPCCILAVIRQTGAVTPAPVFDFKEEMAARMREVNDAQQDDCRSCY